MLTTYLIVSSILFTLCVIASCRDTSTPPNAPAAAIYACAACLGWACVVARFVS